MFSVLERSCGQPCGGGGIPYSRVGGYEAVQVENEETLNRNSRLGEGDAGNLAGGITVLRD